MNVYIVEESFYDPLGSMHEGKTTVLVAVYLSQEKALAFADEQLEKHRKLDIKNIQGVSFIVSTFEVTE